MNDSDGKAQTTHSIEGRKASGEKEMMWRHFAASLAITAAATLAGCVHLSETHPFPTVGWTEDYPIALKPGDVVVISTWVNGPKPGNPSYYPPFVTQEAIAIRRVAKEARLHPSEAALLGAIMTTRVADRTAIDIRDLYDKEAAIWNSIVDALVLMRSGSGTNIFLAIDVGKAVAGLKANGLEALAGLVFDTLDAPFVEVRRIGNLHRSLAPVVSEETPSAPFYLGLIISSGRAELLRGASAMSTPAANEGRWSLKEWEESGACDREGDNKGKNDIANEISGVVFKGALFGVSVDPLASRAITLEDGKRVEQKVQGSRPWAITPDSLNYVFPSDIRAVFWKHPVKPERRQQCRGG